MLRVLLLLAATAFLCLAAVGDRNDTVNWLYLGLAAWALSFAADDIEARGKKR